MPEISHEINIVTLTSDEKNKGLLDPYVIMKNPKDSESLAIDILTFLTGISSRDGERFPILRKAIRAVTNSEVRGLMKVIEELRVENTPLSTSIADHIESFTDYDFAHLLFSNGYVEQSISLEKQLNIIQVADLVLPDKETSFEEYTTMELLSVAMLIVISTFAFRLYPYRPKHFQDCRFRRSMELFTGSTRKNTIYEAGSGWSCYERWGIFRDPKYRRPLR